MELNPRDAELIVGIVARIGVDTGAVIRAIKEELEQYCYQVEHCHVTLLLNAFSTKFTLDERPCELRYNSLIQSCNMLRRDAGNSVMAELALTDIASRRIKNGSSRTVQSRTAYIVNQIKRPEEFDLLRKVYGEHYVQISCHADEGSRIERLTARISEDHPEDPKSASWDIKARELVHFDESEEGQVNGQRVRQVFPLSDVIINASSTAQINISLHRFFRALFGDHTVTPTREEFGMELANTAAQRSADSSRQVGAAILTKGMEIQAIGCNEVPSPRGGTYWEGDEPDGREFALGKDSNEERRRTVLMDLMLRLRDAGALAERYNDNSSIERFLADDPRKLIASSQLMDSLEYGRSVHAEMSAITDAARVGNAVRDCVLYSNTFPCHNCAKHIVAAGIMTVIYNHPYPKSYAKELFADSIAVNPPEPHSHKVNFQQFLGIVGPMYARLFTKARWKKTGGGMPVFDKKTASYIRRTPIPGYLETEISLLDELNTKLLETGYRTNAGAASRPRKPTRGGRATTPRGGAKAKSGGSFG
jgi:deoxycytidylate deaminase